MSDIKVPPPAAKVKRERSPSFPFIPLETAIKRLLEFETKFGRHPSPAKHTGSAWGMKGWTSQAQQTLAALKAYGLVEYTGSADDLTASISNDGRTYLRAQQEIVKLSVLKRLALKPKVIARYFTEWGADRPPDPVCLDRLVLKDGFNEAGARLFLGVYDSTIAFAGLSSSDTEADTDGESEYEAPPPPRANVGDYVLIEVNGALVFKQPKRVEEILEKDGEEWVFVEGESAAVKMEQVSVQAPPAVVKGGTPTVPPVRSMAPTLPADWSEERLIDDGGEEIKIHYHGEPSLERYEFIRDYLAFKIDRLAKVKAKG